MGLVVGRPHVIKGLEPIANFDVKKVRSIFLQFEECCPTPTLWERAFYELLDCFDSPAECSKAFDTLDTDSDGFVDAREILGALAILSKGHLSERLKLLFEIFDFNREDDMGFDEALLMLQRTTGGLRKMTGLAPPPEEVLQVLVKQIWASAKKHRDVRIKLEDWRRWWERDAACRAALQAFTWRPEDQRGLPTPEHWVHIDYTKGVRMAQEQEGSSADYGCMPNVQPASVQTMIPVPPSTAKKGASRPTPSDAAAAAPIKIAPTPVADYESLISSFQDMSESPFVVAS